MARKELLGRITLDSVLSPRGYITFGSTASPVVHTIAVIVLVDYDNLDRLQRNRGVRYAITHVLGKVGRPPMLHTQTVTCRLYGNWFDRQALSYAAQRLLPDVAREFPRAVPIVDQHGSHVVLVRVELAFSLLCDPTQQLTHTYRRRSIPPSLSCSRLPFPNCADSSSCGVATLEPFFRTHVCPRQGCSVEPTDVLDRAEQKMVDSMILIDMVHVARQTNEPIVLVSADDDLWPGIHFILLTGAEVVHVLPRRGIPSRPAFPLPPNCRYSRAIM